jgi:hypothetical protein
MESLIVPSAIQRIRSFLIEMSGMKVKPWATAEETLAALHTTLVARRGCGIFWASLRGLLEALARDLKTRQEASPGTLVDNELLDSERYATLLDEIRAALARQTEEPATFRRLASALSAPALGLLLLLGGATSVGCDGTGLRAPAQVQDASPPAVVDAAQPEANRVLIVVGPTTIPDARPATDAVAPSQSDGAAVTIEDIMDSCNITGLLREQILACLAKLGESWAGLAAGFAGASCSLVDSDLACFVQSQMCGGPNTITFPSDPNAPWICRPLIIYAGVRFV